jgi:hypothetical protein
VVVRGQPEDEAAVQDDGGQGGRQQVDVDLGGDLAPGASPVEDHPGRLGLGPDHARAELRGEVRVVVQGGDDPGHHLRRPLVAQAAV